MKVEVESLGSVKKKLDIHIPKDVVAQEMDSVYRDLSGKVRIKGFRPGKVPLSILKAYYANKIKDQVTAKLISDSYPKALDQNHLDPVSEPVVEVIEFQQGEDFRYSVTVEVKPDISIDEYKGIEIVKQKYKLTDEDVQRRLESLREIHGCLKTINEIRPIRDGDFVTVDFEAFTNDKPLREGKTENYQMEIGAGRMHPDFEKGLIGALPQEVKEITVNFPNEHHNPSLAGKEVKFSVTIREIREKILPNLDDAFAKEVGDYDSLEDLRAKARDEISKEQRRHIEAKIKQDILSKLIENTSFEVPEALVNQETQEMVNDTQNRLVAQGLDVSGMDLAQLQTDIRKDAERKVRAKLILDKIAKIESIEITDEDIDKGLGEIAARLGQDVDTIRNLHIRNNLMDSLRKHVLEERTLNFLVDNANIIEASD